jgi:hypothetical protein
MASVMKQKPTMEPRYPTSGSIHMFAAVMGQEGRRDEQNGIEEYPG